MALYDMLGAGQMPAGLLSEQEQQQLNSNALLNSGLAILAASRGGQQGVRGRAPLIPAIQQGLQAGQNTYGQALQNYGTQAELAQKLEQMKSQKQAREMLGAAGKDPKSQAAVYRQLAAANGADPAKANAYLEAANKLDPSLTPTESPASVREYQYYLRLSPAEQKRYLEVKRSQQFLDLGGAYAGVGPGGQVTNQYDKTLAPENLPEVRAEQARQAAIGKTQGETEGTAQSKLPVLTGQAEDAKSLIKQLKNSPGYANIVGLRGAIPAIPGTKAADAKAILDQIKGKAFMSAYESLRGSGTITEKEGEVATAAVARLQTAQSKEGFDAALTDLEKVLDSGIARTRSMAGKGQAANTDDLVNKYRSR